MIVARRLRYSGMKCNKITDGEWRLEMTSNMADRCKETRKFDYDVQQKDTFGNGELGKNRGRAKRIGQGDGWKFQDMNNCLHNLQVELQLLLFKRPMSHIPLEPHSYPLLKPFPSAITIPPCSFLATDYKPSPQ